MVRPKRAFLAMTLVAAGGALVGVALRPPPAHAQPPGDAEAEPGAEAEGERTEEDPASVAREARAQFQLGLERFREHLYREAIRRFELAASLVPSADLSFNIARSYEELARGTAGIQRADYLDRAIDYYGRYLRDRVDPPDRARIEAHVTSLREQAEQARRSAREHPTEGILVVRVNREGAQIELDGDRVGRSPAEEERRLGPGRHRLELRRDGYIPFRSEVSLEAGVTTAAFGDLEPATRYRSIRRGRVWAWVAWGLAAAALGTAIGLGIHAVSLPQDDRADARTFAAFSDVALGSAIGLGVLGVILWFVEGRAVGTERLTVEEEGPATVRPPR
ncbi:MAG: PEGA domain-containing protein [Sandaracinaceae bacterium]